ncbi:hypothetical protein [Anaerovorax odorimutans]|uniref:hypothetical protein n=1 Tax=Anaerovorax odorimutans TaxID=109327 RepID=UPI0003F4BA1E|nr:hypothetical protein [Anaerovorax odorimutans]
MRKYKKYLIIVILIGTLFLSMLLDQYQIVEGQLNLESNRMYSQNSRVIENLSIIEKNKNLKEYSFRVFGELKEIPFVRSYYSNNYRSWEPMLKEGRFFNKEDTKEAIVGKNVELEYKGNERYYVFNGKKYKVIGYWGIEGSSFMDDQILLNDSRYFEDKNVKTVLDSESIEVFETNGIKFLDIPVKDIWNPINDQFFTEWIMKLSKLLSILVFAFCGIIISLQFKKESEIKHLIGTSKYRIWIKKLWFLCSLFILSFIIVIGYTCFTMPKLIKFEILLKNVIYFIILITSFNLNELYLNYRRLKCGN